MAEIQERKTLSTQEAIDNLAAIVAIDLEDLPPIGIIRGNILVTDGKQVGSEDILWLASEGAEPILEIIDETFRAVSKHFEDQLQNPSVDWNSLKIRKGIAGMAALAGEAAQVMDRYLSLRTGAMTAGKITNRPSYKHLQDIYRNRLEKRIFHLSKEEQPDLEGRQTSQVVDFEAIQNDLDYELLLIKNENGDPYFNSKLLRNIKLSCDFGAEKEEDFEEDPFLRVRSIQDRDIQASAKQLLTACKFEIQGLHKTLKEAAPCDLMNDLSQAIVALYFAANSRNLLQNASGKCCSEYFHDFQIFLRLALSSLDYQKMIAYPKEVKDLNMKRLLDLAHALCRGFFYRAGGVRQEVVGLLHRYMRKGGERVEKAIKGDTIYNQMLINDEKFRTQLRKYPNGPLIKVLDLVRETEAESLVFDPLMQGNIPQKICDIRTAKFDVAVLRFPCPLRQFKIDKVELAEEFGGFLRSCAKNKTVEKHLLINLQDRTSWKEQARSQAIERLQNNSEFSQQLIVATLPKSTDFYYQSGKYLNVGEWNRFKTEFLSQLSSSEESSFFFPPACPKQEIESFCEKAFVLIHKLFFDAKGNLSRQNREDFIEIFYQLLIFKWIELINPHSISFTCKDSIDTGALQTASFLACIDLLSQDFAAHGDFLRWVVYAPSLLIRERGPNAERVMRMISICETIGLAMQENHLEIFKTFSGLYHREWLETLKVQNR